MDELLSLNIERGDGWRLDAYLSERLPVLSRHAWQAHVSAGRVLVNGQRVRKSRRIRSGDVLSIPRSLVQRSQPPDAVRVIHQDRWLLGVSKRAGLKVHPTGPLVDETLIEIVKRQFPEAHLCHRLDKLTSGVMLLARGPGAAARIGNLVERGLLVKRYLALVEGYLTPDSGTVDAPIGRDWTSEIRLKVTVCEDGQPSRTHFRVLRRRNGRTLLSVLLETGRKHQIRCHLASLGHPIVGDFLYGPEEDLEYFEDRRHRGRRDEERFLALHAEELSLPHPWTGRWLTIRAVPPPRFLRLLAEAKSEK